jgi:hypothetical protein
MDGYGQFCPVAKAAEVLDQRWTLLVSSGNGSPAVAASTISIGVSHACCGRCWPNGSGRSSPKG